MQMCVLGKEDMREVVDSVFCALYSVCLGRAISWHRQDRNRQSMQRVQGTGKLGLVCVKILEHNSSFAHRRFLHFWHH